MNKSARSRQRSKRSCDKFSLRMTPDVLKFVRNRALAEDVSVNKYINNVLQNHAGISLPATKRTVVLEIESDSFGIDVKVTM